MNTITTTLGSRSQSKIVDQHIPCPSCTSSDGYCTYDDGHGYCFACTFYKPPTKEGSEDFKELDTGVYTYQYIPHRGLLRESLEKYEVKTKVDAEGKPVSVGFKYPNGSFKIRELDKKAFTTQGDIAKAGLFGRDKFAPGSHGTVTITEGEYDAVALYQVTRTPVVSVRSSVSAQSDCAIDREWLNSFSRIYLAFDSDEPGRAAAAKVAKLFDYNKVYDVKFDGGRKDANDYVRDGADGELATVWNNAKKFLPESVISSFSEFERILKEPLKQGIAYPFPTLNYMTYGIRTGESVLITAQEGVGKTEVMHAIEYQIFKETNDAVAAIFLEEPKRRHLQALAGLHIGRPVHLPDSNCPESSVVSALKQAIGSDDRLHLYSHFGSDDPDVLLDTIRFLVTARACRYVLFDHITMGVSGLGGENERRALDYLSTRLEMMVKELDFALILVSHVNDDGLTRGSRNISKVADIRIDLTRDIKASDPIIRNTTNLMVSKNRFCGRTGPAGKLLFDPFTYTYSEIVDGLEPANDNSGTQRMVV